MPLPTPGSGENRSGFVSRCISFLSDEGSSIPAGAARTAACFSRWRQFKGGKPPTKEEIIEVIGKSGSSLSSGQLDEIDDLIKEIGKQTKPQDKPGGANVGRYAGVKRFCGPSGGAPAGSYPVNTRKRAIAALAYARNAPNPAGIKKCVCRAYPGLPACAKGDMTQEEILQMVKDEGAERELKDLIDGPDRATEAPLVSPTVASSGQEGAIAGQYPELEDLPKDIKIPKKPYESFADEEDDREVQSP